MLITVDLLRPVRRIVIQGVRGAFHEIAARQFYGQDIEIIPALSFAALFEKTADESCSEAAMLAIENSIAGSILGNYNLLQSNDLVITGEVYLRIEQHLMALPGVRLEALREVQSHPMALAQCKAFFRKNPHLRLVEAADTAESAERIHQLQLTDTAAVGSELAAQLYGLEIIARCIETDHRNYTRFLAVERRATAETIVGANKASVSFSTPHEPGALSRVLSMLAAHDANLTKIQSTPILGKPWEYLFFTDFVVEQPEQLPEVLQLLESMTHGCKVLGVYKEGLIKIEEN
jgi:prephenate dehydratase